MAEVFKTPAEKVLEDRYSPDESLNRQADDVLADLGFVDEETGIIQPEVKPEESPSIIEEATQEVSTEIKETATAVKESGRIVAGAVVDLTQELGNFAIDSANALDNWMKERGYTNQDFIKEEFRLDYANRLVPQSENTSDRVARKLGGYLIPFTGAFKALKGAGVANVGIKAVAAGAATSFAAIDPNEDNLSNMIQEESELLAPIASLLAITKDDSKLEARFKNAIESLVIDAAFLGGGKALVGLSDITFKHMKAVKAARKLTKRNEKIAEAAKVIEAEGEGVLRVSSKDIIPGSDVNLLTISQDKNLLKIIKDAAKKDLPGIQKARGKGGLDKAAEEAKLIQESPARIRELLQSGEERILNASETIAANQLFEKSLGEVKIILDKGLSSGKAVDEIASLEAFQTLQRIQRVVFGNKAEQGRALAAHKFSLQAKGAAKKSEYIANVIELRGGKAANREDLLAIREAFDVEPHNLIKRGNELVEKSMMAKLGDAGYEVFINGLVSSFKTIGVAIVNGMFRVPLEVAERGLAAMFTRKKPLGERVFFSEATEQIKASFDESATQFYAILGGLFDGAKIASHPRIVEALKRNKDVPGFLDILKENNIYKSINAKNFGLEGFAGEATDAIGSVISLPTSILRRTDKSIGAIHQRMEARALASREASIRGLRGEEYLKFIDELTDVPPSSLNPQMKELANQIKDKAVAQANVARFLNPLEGIAASVENIFHAPGLRVLVPFARIGLNILVQSMERIPGLAGLTPAYKRAMQEGGQAAAMAKARVALGGTFMMGVGAMVATGNLTGDGPRDPTQRKLLESQGWQSNSIRIGDNYVKYDRFAEPITRAIRLAANMAEISGYIYGEMQDENLSANAKDIMAATVGVLAETASPEFLTGGLGDLISAIENPERSGFESILKTVVTGHVPFSSLLRSIRQEVDPLKRTTKSLDDSALGVLEQQWNEIKNMIPGFSDTLPPQRNMFGEVVHYPPGLGPDMMSPIYVTEFKKDIVIEELIRLGSAGPLMHPKAKPGEEHLVIRMPSNTISNSAAGVSQPIRMSPQQYDKFVQLAAGIGLEGVDLTLKEKLKEIIESDYADFDGIEKTDQLKRTLIAKWVNAYRDIAEAQLVMEEQDIQTQMRENFDNINQAFGGEGL